MASVKTFVSADTKQLFKQVGSIPAGYTSDDIFYSTKAGIIYENTDIDIGLTSLAFGIFANGSDMTARINYALAHTKVKHLKLYAPGGGEILVTGTVNGQGKIITFLPGMILKTTGAGLIQNFVIDAPATSFIFSGTQNVQPLTTVQNFYSVNWMGANTGGYENGATISKAGQIVIKNTNLPRDLYFPDKTYSCTTPAIFYNYDSTSAVYTQVSINLIGNSNSRLTGNPTALLFTNKNEFGIGIHIGKGCTIDGLAVWGPFNPSFSTFKQFVETKYTDYGTAEACRENRYSPNCGIIIDPFKSNNGNGYPSLNAYYIGGATGSGSTGIIIKNCSIRNWVLGVGYSINGETQNCDSMTIQDCNIDYNKVGVAYGQDQTKNCLIKNIICWGNTHTFMTNNFFGAGSGAPPFIDGVSFAGLINQVVFCETSGRFNFAMRNIFGESLYRIGRMTGQPSSITDSNFNFILADYPNIMGNPDAYLVGNNVTIRDCVLRLYDNLFNKRLYFAGTNINFKNCRFDAPPVFQLQDTILPRNTFESCTFGAGTLILDKRVNMKLQDIANITGSARYGDITLTDGLGGNEIRTFTTSEADYETATQLGFKTLTVNATTRTGTFPHGASIAVDTVIYAINYDNSITYFDTALVMTDPIIGRVTGYSGGNVQIAEIPPNISSGSYLVGTKSFKVMNNYFFVGDLDGTFVMKNVEGNVANMIGASFQHDGSYGTITAWNAGTKEATFVGATTTATDISNVPMDSKITYRSSFSLDHGSTVGSIFLYKGTIWRTQEFIDGKAVDREYLVTKSGYVRKTDVAGAVRQAEWVVVNITGTLQIVDSYTITTDGARSIEVNKLVSKIHIKPTANMTINIGTAPGATDIADSLDVTAGVTTPLYPGRAFDGGGTLYFTGITGSTAIKIFKEAL